jgi:hypothetical protein
LLFYDSDDDANDDDDDHDDHDEYTNLCNLCFLLFLFIYSSSFFHYTLFLNLKLVLRGLLLLWTGMVNTEQKRSSCFLSKCC